MNTDNSTCDLAVQFEFEIQLNLELISVSHKLKWPRISSVKLVSFWLIFGNPVSFAHLLQPLHFALPKCSHIRKSHQSNSEKFAIP